MLKKETNYMNKNVKKIGAFPGKFLPPHIGHINTILECAKKCDKLLVVVADSEKNSRALCEKSNIPYMPVKLRINWLKTHFKNHKNIKIVYMNEDKLGTFPAPMDVWSKAFKKITKHKVNMKFADETYRTLNELYFPECEFICFDRQVINISATMIRDNPEKYFDYIIAEAKPYFKEILNKTKRVSN